MQATSVSVKNLSKTYSLAFKKFQALKNLNLEIQKNEIYGFLGPNGAGKTTTLKILVGVLRPTSGEFEIFGSKTLDEETKKKIGFLPENPSFLKNLRAFELLKMMGYFFNYSKEKTKKRIDELLDLVGLTEFRNSRLSTYSRGMTQRIGIAQALFHDPELLILDEPMTGLDPLGRKLLYDLILKLRDEEKTIILATHDLEDAESLCDRVAIIDRGELIDEINIKKLYGESLKSYDVLFSWEKEMQIENVKILKSGDLFKAEIPSEESLWKFFEIVKRKGGKIINVKPFSGSVLQKIYLEKVKSSDVIFH
ncbi:MAG: ABC transporter ATP-binding protein [Acidobacteriota bacterium]